MEKEGVLNSHESSSLANTTEEAVNNTSSRVGVETSGSGGLDAGANHNASEEKGDGQTAEVSAQGYDEQTASSTGE